MLEPNTNYTLSPGMIVELNLGTNARQEIKYLTPEVNNPCTLCLDGRNVVIFEPQIGLHELPPIGLVDHFAVIQSD